MKIGSVPQPILSLIAGILILVIPGLLNITVAVYLIVIGILLVSSAEEAARRIVQLLKDKKLRKRLGEKGKEIVKKRFLMTRYLEQYLDLFSSFEPIYRLKKRP